MFVNVGIWLVLLFSIRRGKMEEKWYVVQLNFGSVTVSRMRTSEESRAGRTIDQISI